MSNAISVKDRLKNIGLQTGKTMQEMLTAYGLERSIYRLSISKYKENFILKGGIFLYALFKGDYARATTDIDLLGQRINNESESIKSAFEEVFSIETSDPLRFDIDTLTVKPIAELKKYHGVNVSIVGYLDRTRVPVSIDIGFGDIIYPDRVELDFPTVLGDDQPHIYAYSLYSSVAEKFEAIVSLAYDNSRFKDYYDIYVLSSTYDFDAKELLEAIKETFVNRHTSITDIAAFEEGFADEPIRKSRWNSFVKKKKALLETDLQSTIDLLKILLGPIAEAITNNVTINGTWNHETRAWEQF